MGFFRRAVDGVLPPLGQGFCQGLFGVLNLLFTVAGPLGRGNDGNEPVQVGMAELPDLPGRTTFAPGRLTLVTTEEGLSNVQGEALLADTGRPDKKDRLWKPAGGNGALQPVEQRLVSVKSVQTHRMVI